MKTKEEYIREKKEYTTILGQLRDIVSDLKKVRIDLKSIDENIKKSFVIEGKTIDKGKINQKISNIKAIEDSIWYMFIIGVENKIDELENKISSL